MRQQATLSGEVGGLVAGALKDAVLKCQWEGYHIDLYLGSGWLSKEFKIRGDYEAVMAIRNWLEKISKNDS